MTNDCRNFRNYFARDLSVAHSFEVTFVGWLVMGGEGNIWRFAPDVSLSSHPNSTKIVISTKTLRVSVVLTGEISS